MKYVKQFGIIIMISFVGEVLNYLIPIPVPASIYGMVIMLVLLTSGKLKLESVRDTAIFLIEVMPKRKDEDLEDILRIYSKLSRRDKHDFMSMVYEFEKRGGDNE